MKSSIIVFLTATSLLTLSACYDNSPTDLPPGTYVNKTESKDRAGTDYKAKTTTEVGYDEYGNKTAVVTTKKTTDPKGLFNKQTDTSTTVVK